jgi:hypothetical protein
MVTDMFWMRWVAVFLKTGRAHPKTRANINNLMGFLDAFKAVPLV